MRATLSLNELVHSLKQQIDALTEEQTNALETAVYVGMTPDEAKGYNKRRHEISRLIAELTNLQTPDKVFRVESHIVHGEQKQRGGSPRFY